MTHDETDITLDTESLPNGGEALTQAPAEEGEECFFGGDISFDSPLEYDDEPDKLKTLKSVFSMTHLSLFVYLMVSQGVATVILLLSSLAIAAVSEGTVNLSSDFYLVLSAVCQYVIAFPLFLLMTKGIKKSKRTEGERLSSGSFLLILLISEGVMLVGGVISTLLTKLTERIFGNPVENALDAAVGDASLWIVFVSVCVLAPVVEEIMFRKTVIDRLSVFGDGVAIVFSAVAFGFFHGNLSQFIYAAGVGLVFGYVYARTRRIGYTIALHAIVNFFGGVVAMGVEWLDAEAQAIRAGGDAAIALEGERLFFYELIVNAYVALQLLLALGAIVALVILIAQRKIRVDKEKEIELNTGTVIKAGMANPGFILLYAMCALLIFISMIPA